VEEAYGTTVAPLANVIKETNRQITELAPTLEIHLEQHPDAVIYHS